jgi:hypothetical protein
MLDSTQPAGIWIELVAVAPAVIVRGITWATWFNATLV